MKRGLLPTRCRIMRSNLPLSDDLNYLQGSAHIRVPNTSADPWTYLIFRLYPELEHYGGEFSIQNAAVEGSTTPFTYLEQKTAVRVELPRALLRGQTATVFLSWRLEIPQWGADTDGAYRLFGYSQDILSLPLFYPSLAVYQPGPTAASGRWWLERGTSRGDAAFNYTSQFVVTGTVPSDQIPVTSGRLITSTTISEGQVQRRWETGPSREFLIHLSNRFQSDSLDAYGTRVTSYWLPEHEEAGRGRSAAHGGGAAGVQRLVWAISICGVAGGGRADQLSGDGISTGLSAGRAVV